jgi:hypothetical protein
MFKAIKAVVMLAVLAATQVHAKETVGGWHFNMTPTIVVTKDHTTGIGADPELRYNYKLANVFLSVGGRTGIYYAQDLFGVTLMPTAQLTVPGETFDTYIAFGHGVGTLPNNDHTDKATMSKVGVLIHFTEKFSLSIEGTNQNIYNSEFSFVSFGSAVIYEF